MIQEEYVTFETAKLLKEVGFSEMTMDYYYKGKFNADLGVMTNLWDDWNAQTDIDIVAAPSQSLAMRWLREEKKLAVIPNMKPHNVYGYWLWGYYLWDRGNTRKYVGFRGCFFGTYEAAVETGIKAACQYLIKKGGEK